MAGTRSAAERRAAIELSLKQINALNARREKQQGLGRPIIAPKLRDHQMVAVGNRIYFSKKWQTFHDFLRDQLFGLLGKEWGLAELAKPEDQRHRILRWFDQANEHALQTGTKVGGVYTAPMSGAARAFLNLAYNIYLIAHHAGQERDAIVKGYIDRLKSTRSDDFTGALFETYAAAAFLKAGFSLAFENEKDGSVSHVEFVALYPKTGKRFSVEVKAREGNAVTDTDDIKRLRVANKLNKALGKKADHTRVVMIEINVPDVVTSYDGWPNSAMEQIRHNERSEFSSGEKKPSAYVFVTNHAFHNNLTATDIGLQVLAAGFRIPDFGPDAIHKSYKEILASRSRHAEMFALVKSMQTHYEIPSTFDGEMPQLAFGQSKEPRLQFGRTYLVPTADGREAHGRLYDAVVDVARKQVVGVYQLLHDGASIIANSPLSDAELAAYQAYPETFFGQIRQPARRAETLVELCDSFYETYKNVSRDNLLEWLSTAPDMETLRSLPQEELAIIISERWALGAYESATKQSNSQPPPSPNQ
jgi:hypothetical protein